MRLLFGTQVELQEGLDDFAPNRDEAVDVAREEETELECEEYSAKDASKHDVIEAQVELKVASADLAVGSDEAEVDESEGGSELAEDEGSVQDASQQARVGRLDSETRCGQTVRMRVLAIERFAVASGAALGAV